MNYPVFGYVLQFDDKTNTGLLVLNLNVSYATSNFFQMKFGKRDIHPAYKQPMEGDRVMLEVVCGQDNVPWYIFDGSLRLVCRPTMVELVGS